MAVGKSNIASASFFLAQQVVLRLKFNLEGRKSFYLIVGLCIILVLGAAFFRKPSQVDELFFEQSNANISRKIQIEDFEKLEKRILTSLPKNLQYRASLYIKAVVKVSAFHKIDPILVLSVMWTESHFRDHAKSSVGAYGLMQLMPSTKKYLRKRYKMKGNELIAEQSKFALKEYFPEALAEKKGRLLKRNLENIEIAIIYLSRLLKRFDNNRKYAIVAYNMGPSWTQRRLRRNLPVGVKNHYLSKVEKAYAHLTRRI